MSDLEEAPLTCNPPSPRRHLRVRWAARGVLGLYLALALLYSVVTPLFEGYDENWHYAFVHHLTSGQGLPRQPASEYPHLAHQEASQPPLYYALAAALIWWVPDNDLAAYLQANENPQFVPLPLPYRDNRNMMVHRPAEGFPFRGVALAVHLARLLSVALGAGVVWCTYALARVLFPAQETLALLAMALVAWTPGFIFTSALVNNDILVAFLSALTLLWLARLWSAEASTRRLVGLGLLLGAAALTKLSGLLLWALAGAVLGLRAWQGGRRQRLLRWAGLVYLPALLVCGWWFARNLALYGDLTGLGSMLDLMGRRAAGFGLGDAWAEAQGVRWSYWALFGQTNLPLPFWLYRLWDALLGVGLLGMAWHLLRLLRGRAWGAVARWVFLAAWAGAVAVALVRWTLLTTGSQGRLLYPAVGALSLLLAQGWLAWTPMGGRWRAGMAAALAGAFLAAAAAAPFLVIAPAYAQPAVLHPQEAAARAQQPAAVRFGEGVRLLGYTLQQVQVAPG
ncbi:MAG: hypothetical protein GX605_04330, partial [Chloroflexi bacterium]|nr:hypothetical protein [Chloroflexota bacterium]